MAIRIQPTQKQQRQIARFSPVLLSMSVVLLVLVAAAYGYFWYTAGKLEAEVQDMRSKVEPEVTIENNKAQSLLDVAGARAVWLPTLLKEHRRPTRLLRAVEQTTQQRTQLSRLSYDQEKRVLTFSGTTDTYRQLAQQYDVFQETALFSKPSLGQVSVGRDGNIDFSLTAQVAPRVLQPAAAEGTTTPLQLKREESVATSGVNVATTVPESTVATTSRNNSR